MCQSHCIRSSRLPIPLGHLTTWLYHYYCNAYPSVCAPPLRQIDRSAATLSFKLLTQLHHAMPLPAGLTSFVLLDASGRARRQKSISRSPSRLQGWVHACIVASGDTYHNDSALTSAVRAAFLITPYPSTVGILPNTSHKPETLSAALKRNQWCYYYCYCYY